MEEFNIQGKQTPFYKHCPVTFGYSLVFFDNLQYRQEPHLRGKPFFLSCSGFAIFYMRLLGSVKATFFGLSHKFTLFDGNAILKQCRKESKNASREAFISGQL
jgi:hypothetical protein